MVALVLDTNAVSAFPVGHPEVVNRIDPTPELHLPATVIGEFSYGALESAEVAVNLRKLDVLAAGCEIIACDAEVART